MFMMRDFFLFSFYPTFLCSVFLGKDNFLISEKSIVFQELCRKACGVKIKCVNLRHLTDGYTNSITSELAEVL